MQRKQILLCLSIGIATAGCTTMKDQIASSGTMGKSDADYVTTAMQLIQLDTQAGALAATHAADPRVIDVANSLTAQATAFSPSLTAVAQVEGIKPDAAPAPDVVAEVAKLKGLNGAAFDHQFIADELAVHRRAITVLKQEDATTKDGAMRTQVETELPAVQGNYDKLQTLAGNGTASG